MAVHACIVQCRRLNIIWTKWVVYVRRSKNYSIRRFVFIWMASMWRNVYESVKCCDVQTMLSYSFVRYSRRTDEHCLHDEWKFVTAFQTRTSIGEPHMHCVQAANNLISKVEKFCCCQLFSCIISDDIMFGGGTMSAADVSITLKLLDMHFLLLGHSQRPTEHCRITSKHRSSCMLVQV